MDINELDEDRTYHLLHGFHWFGGFGDDRDAFEEAWEIHGERLLAEFVAEHPGRRPFAWWLLEHRQERPVVAPWATPQEVAECRNRPGKFGFLDTRLISGLRPGGGYWELQEPEPEYLRRLGLLLPGELDGGRP